MNLVIKINNSGVNLNPGIYIPIGQTNFPFQYCKFTSHRDLFWGVEILNYDPETKALHLKVANYSLRESVVFQNQALSYEVNKIIFNKLEWPQLKQQLSSYQKIKMRDMLNNHDEPHLSENDQKIRPAPDFSDLDAIKYAPGTSTGQDPYRGRKTTRNTSNYYIEFSIPFADSEFKLGSVNFTKHIPQVNNSIEIGISNEYVLPEFDSIKSWFSRKLKKKSFKVFLKYSIKDRKVEDVDSSSPDIDKIDNSLIESIKFDRTIALSKPQRLSDVDKSLFTAEDVFDEVNLTKDLISNVFKQEEQEIFKILIENYKPRNYRHLEYLSDKKQSLQSKLKFTLHPYFGFLFLIEGEENNHFVWELLNSHATYIWSIKKSENDLPSQYKRIESTINFIRINGREKYIREYKQNHIDRDLIFIRIEHSSISSDAVDGFVKWKHHLNEIIT